MVTKAQKEQRFRASAAATAARRARAAGLSRPDEGPAAESVLGLATEGHAAAVISERLGIRGRLATDADFRGQFERDVAHGHAEHQVEIQRLLLRAAKRGGSTAIQTLATAWVAKYGDKEQELEFAGGYQERLEALIAKAKARSTP